jgi:hypothetical protein
MNDNLTSGRTPTESHEIIHAVDIVPAVKALSRHDRHVVVQHAVHADASQAQLVDGQLEVRLPVGPRTHQR